MILFLSVLLCLTIVSLYYKLATIKANLKNTLNTITQLEQQLELLKNQTQALLKKEMQLIQEKNKFIESINQLQQEYKKTEAKLTAAYEECHRARQRAKRLQKDLNARNQNKKD